MRNTQTTTGIVKFNGGHFQNWKFRVEKHLGANGCTKPICGYEAAGDGAGDRISSQKFAKIDLKAEDLITSLISENFLEYVRDQTAAKGMWESLCATFDKGSCQGQTLVRKNLANFKLLENGSLNAHLIKFDLISQLFITLPASYDVVVTALANLAQEDLKLSILKSRLLG